MFKMNLKKMVLTAAAAAMIACVPAMAAEDIIVEESVETVEAAEETATEAEQEEQLELAEVEAIDAAEIPEEVAEAAETQVTEGETKAESFFFENDEVIVKAAAAVELPENVEMKVTKLEEGSEAYEAAKAAAVGSCGADENAEYKFYSVGFMADGQEIEIEDDKVCMQIEFKTVKVDSSARTQSILHIDETEVKDVTAQSEQGSNMSSVNFTI